MVPAIGEVWRLAGVALEQTVRSQLAIRPPAAARTREAIRPSRGNHHGAALRLSAIQCLEARLAEALLKLHLVARHHCTPRLNVHTLCQTIRT
jgi:hypothetical protein